MESKSMSSSEALHKAPVPQKTIIWDWNGTLFQDVEACIAAENVVLSRRGLPLLSSAAAYRQVFTFPVRDYYQAVGLDFTAESFEALAEEYMVLYREYAKSSGLYPHGRQVVEALQEQGCHQIIVSASGQQDLDQQVDRLGLGQFFEAVLGIGNVYAAGKEGLAGAYLTQRQLPKESALFVGDTAHDVDTARQAGAACVLVAGGHQSTERLRETGSWVLGGIEELPCYVGGLTLHPLTQSHAQAVFSMTSDPRVSAFMRFDTHTTQQQAVELIEEYTSPGNVAVLAKDRETGLPAGVAAIKRGEGEEGTVSVFLAPAFWGKGHARTLMGLLQCKARELGLHRLLAYILTENVGSWKMAERSGFLLGETKYFPDCPQGLRIYQWGTAVQGEKG